MNPAILVPIIVPVALFALVFGIYYLRTRENMALIEKGINPKQFSALPAPFRTLKAGLLLLGAGMGLLTAYLIDQASRFSDIESIYFALLAIGGGLGLVASYFVERKEYDRKEGRNA